MRREEIISDNQILGKIKSGDITCFEYLYKRYKGKIYNFVLSLSDGDFYLAEEITQNVFLRIWEIRKDMNTTESVSSFMYTVSRNMFLNTVKRRAQEALYQASLQQEYNEADNTVEAEIEYKLLEQEINRLIEQLPPARQRIYRLSKQRHFSNKEIAEMLHISENTVESNLYKATLFMRKILSLRYDADLIIVAFLLAGIN